MTARATLFASIRRSLGVTGDEPARRAAVAERIAKHPRGVIPARGQLPPQERVKLFAQMVEAANGTAEMLPSAANVPAAVAAFLRAHNLPMQIRRGDDPRLAALPWDSAAHARCLDRPLRRPSIASVSHAFGGVAETGTLIMASGRTIRPR
jgi:L-lactate dehydrogenase complex protein LldG